MRQPAALMFVVAFYGVLLLAIGAVWLFGGWPNAWLAFAVTLATAPVAIGLYRAQDDGSEGVRADLRKVAQALDTMSRESGLSEAAKRVLHRRQHRIVGADRRQRLGQFHLARRPCAGGRYRRHEATPGASKFGLRLTLRRLQNHQPRHQALGGGQVPGDVFLGQGGQSDIHGVFRDRSNRPPTGCAAPGRRR